MTKPLTRHGLAMLVLVSATAAAPWAAQAEPGPAAAMRSVPADTVMRSAGPEAVTRPPAADTVTRSAGPEALTRPPAADAPRAPVAQPSRGVLDRLGPIRLLDPGAPNGSQINADPTGPLRSRNSTLDPLSVSGTARDSYEEDRQLRERLRDEAQQRQLSTAGPARGGRLSTD